MYEKTGVEHTRHIFAGNQRIAEVKNGAVSFFHNDHLGSPRVVSDSNGVPGLPIATKPFGEPHVGNTPTSYGFTGKDLDDTGLYYFAARYYDASVGRFISPDPHWNHHNMIYGDDPDNKFPLISAITQSTNLYIYCANNPLLLVDPDGKDAAVAREIFRWGWSTGVVISQLDSPLPGPADAIGLVIGVGATVVAGGLILHDALFAKNKPINLPSYGFLTNLLQNIRKLHDIFFTWLFVAVESKLHFIVGPFFGNKVMRSVHKVELYLSPNTSFSELDCAVEPHSKA